MKLYSWFGDFDKIGNSQFLKTMIGSTNQEVIKFLVRLKLLVMDVGGDSCLKLKCARIQIGLFNSEDPS